MGSRFLTRSLAPGHKVYGEETVKAQGSEYREWNPRRSKLGAALAMNLKLFPFQAGSKVLYLGAASGTILN